MNTQLQTAMKTHPPAQAQDPESSQTFVLPPLPYAEHALEPVISAATVRVHYHQHQQGYVDSLNKLVAATPFARMSLTQVLLATAGDPMQTQIFNNAAQAWNHAFYWRSLRPQGGGEPPAALRSRVEAGFGGVAGLTDKLLEMATTQFGSGWVWLVSDGATLKAVKTGNAENPLTRQLKPLLAIDVWEHAYYLDYQSRRHDYVAGVLKHLINWDFATDNISAA